MNNRKKMNLTGLKGKIQFSDDYDYKKMRETAHLLIVQTAIENDLCLLHDDRDFSNIAKIEKNLKEYQ